MPRNVRNFWITLDIDGKKTQIATGPRQRIGGFQARIKMRSEGQIFEEDILIEGRVRQGLLTLNIYTSDSEPIFSRTTKA